MKKYHKDYSTDAKVTNNGKVVEEFGFPSLEVSSMQKLEVKADPRSLDFIQTELS